jgi:anti-anti-sigma factor
MSKKATIKITSDTKEAESGLDRVSSKINQLLIPKILEQRIKYLVFNLFEISDIDMFGVEALLNAKCAIKTNKGKICLCEVSDTLNKKLKMYKLKRTQSEINAMSLIGEI